MKRPRRKRAFKAAEFISTHPVFRFEEFLEAHGASGAAPTTTDALLRYYVGTGRLMNLKRGLYANSQDPDLWLVGSRLSPDAVIAYEGALSFHGLGWEGHSISYLTAERASRFVFDEMIYQPVRVPAPLSSKRNWGGGIATVERAGQKLKVTTPERTLVDLLDRLDLSHGTPALWDSFCRGKLDWGEMIAYAKQLDSRLLIGRLAVFLQLLGATNRVLDTVDAYAPRSACYFDRRERSKGDAIYPRWNVIVPIGLIRHINSGATAEPGDDD